MTAMGATWALGAEQGDQEESCSPIALRMLATRDYEHRIWASLGEYRGLEADCRASEFAPHFPMHRAQLESFVGNHDAALQYADHRWRWMDQELRAKPANEPKDALPDDTQALDAVTHLTKLASDQQIVMVNERHHVSADRLLTLSLLRPLAERGFRYLALEAAWIGDDVNERGYAIGQTGYYINDVVFAEVVREAIALGYEIVAYEIEDRQRGQAIPEQPDLSSQAKRDYWQARNLVDRTFAKDPKAKVLVHCGYDHLRKIKSEHWTPMGYFLKQMTGLEPLTVDQVKLSERGAPEFEDSVRREAKRLGLVKDAPIVLADGEGLPLPLDADIDVHVLAPRTRYERERPTWMGMFGRRRGVAVETPQCAQTRCIIAARAVNEPDAVPFDRLELSQRASALLYLPPSPDVAVAWHDTDTGEPLGQWQSSVAAMSPTVPK